MGHRFGQAAFLVLLMLLTPLSGCFGQQDGVGLESAEDVVITPPVLTGGVFQGLTIAAETDLSAFVPYLILNQDSGFVQNSTIVDLKAVDSVLLNVLAPPRTDTAVILIGDYGRDDWPIRDLQDRGRPGMKEMGKITMEIRAFLELTGPMVLLTR